MTAVCAKLSFAIAILAILVGVSSAQIPVTNIYFAQQIHTGLGEVIDDGALVVSAGKIISVGPRSNVSIPPGAIQHELDSQIIIPGLVAVQTNLSGSQSEERTLTPTIQALDGFDFFADRLELLRTGITTIQVSPSTNRLMPGVGGVVQVAGESIKQRILKERESLQIILSQDSRNPPRIYEPPVGPVSQDRPLEPTRPQLASLTASLNGLRQIFSQATNAKDDSDPIIEAVSELLSQKTPIRISARTAPEIRGAVQLATEFDLQIILTDCVGLQPFKKSLASWKPHVKGVVLAGMKPGEIANPTTEQIEQGSQPWDHAKALVEAGIPVAVRTKSDADLERLMFVAGQFMQGDLSSGRLLSAVTSVPAAMMGVDQQVGSLEKGKLADFVVLTDQPFQLHTRVVATYASGQPVFQRRSAASTTVINADRIYVGDGRYLENGSVVVKGKTIRGVGTSVSAPTLADVKSYPGAVIVPGFIDMGTGLGLGGPLQGTVTLQTKLGEQLYVDDPAIAYAREHGITTALLRSTSGSASPVVAFKLGNDARVIGDPVAIRFILNGGTAAAIVSNEKLLAAGKKYSDSWIKYESDLADYEKKQKEIKSKPVAKVSTDPKKLTETKKPASQTEAKKDDEKQDEKKDEKVVSDKKETKDKPEKKDQKEPVKVLPDPITGTWEGRLESERLPETLLAAKFELTLEDEAVTGTVEMLRSTSDVTAGSFDRQTKELSITFSRRENDVTIAGTLDDEGGFSGEIELGRMGTIAITATRTVDKSKKPEPKPKTEPKDEEKKDPESKEKPVVIKEGTSDKPEKDKPADEEKKIPADKQDKDAENKDKTETKAEEKADAK
ncbi:MAG: imidazolonepropionase-like amidohydrolase, partial [Mariniblastus sp.]